MTTSMDAKYWAKAICLCTPTTLPIKALMQSDEWIMEEKYDGDRVVIHVEDNEVRAFGRRNALEVPKRLRRLNWNALTMVLDGEMLGDRYMVFDILSLRNIPATTVSLRQRKQILDTLAPHFPEPVQVVPFAKAERDKLSLLRGAVETDKEGVVVKLLDSNYISGRGMSWQKLKFYKTLDAVVMSIADDDGGRPEAARLGLWFSGAFSPKDLRDICGVKIPMKYQLRDKVQVGDVVEVRYLSVSNDMRLVQPVYMRKRTDKEGSECYARQMIEGHTSLPYYMGVSHGDDM